MARSKNIKNPLITVYPSQFLQCLSSSSSSSASTTSNSLLFFPRKNPSRNHQTLLCSSSNLYLFFLSILTFFTLFEITNVSFKPISHYSSSPCSNSFPSSTFFSSSFPNSRSALVVSDNEDVVRLSSSVMVPLPAHGIAGNLTEEEREFWRQPDGAGYKPCLKFSIGYRRSSAKISKEKRRFLIVVASGGLNQQRNQIVDAVVIARILGAAMVIPILQVNLIWGDESEFSEIFDAEHFKRTLQADVRIVSSLPSSHLVSRQIPETRIPLDVSPLWIRTRFSKQLNEEGVLVLKGLDSKLSKNLPSDLQKLRCKVAFHALRFAAPILEIGNRLARRMWIEGPYIAIHLRLEKDVWIRTGCRTGLGPSFDDIIAKERDSRPEFLTGRLNMSENHRRLAGLCPLNALEVARLLKGLGAPRSAPVYCAGGEPFGGTLALQPLITEFPNLVTKETLAREGELAPFINKSSALAAIDYIVSLSSDVFMASHGGNMGSAMQGQRAYVGHRKYVKPNKRAMIPYFEETSISNEEFSSIMRHLHRELLGQPQSRNNKRGRDVIAYPVPECMCRG
ncbi:GDP-fucose protein O-fucosyltransferase [Macleaya cordata]|uniref:O-fucosyltransferase family protein n=1 Tax=Macleaya cordata TaxID=56857 RepID=A0A200R4B1_MACCD|nr:GDP-fucose protein O-fucosyltransferase [Macleaya cordata]